MLTWAHNPHSRWKLHAPLPKAGAKVVESTVEAPLNSSATRVDNEQNDNPSVPSNNTSDQSDVRENRTSEIVNDKNLNVGSGEKIRRSTRPRKQPDRLVYDGQ